MIGCVSSIFWRGQMPANMTDPVRWKECIVYFSSSWVSMTPGIKVVPDGSKVNWFGEARLQGSDWEAEDPVSVLCKVQSCVTYWHLCLLWVPLGPLLSVEKHTHTRKRKKKKLSPCLVLCSQPELDEYSHGENTSGMQHQQRCLASCIYWFLLIVACFSIESPNRTVADAFM